MTIHPQCKNLAVATAGALLLITLAGSAKAQTYTVGISGSSPNLGAIVSTASGADTIWRVDPATQAVTLQSGGAVRLSSNLTRATVTITCSGGGCNTGSLIVTVGSIGTPTNRARRLTNFTVAMGTATLTAGPSGADPVVFTINNSTSSQTFYVGADFAVAPDSSGLGTGLSTAGFYVDMVKIKKAGDSGTNETSGTGAAVATVYRPIAISSSQSLTFATIVKPRTGGGSVAVSKVDGSPTVSGGVLIGTTKQAKFSVSGEGGQTFTLAIPSSFNLTGPSTIPVSLDSTGTSSATLSSSLGSAGTYNFNVGGTLSFDSSTATGSYTGQFSVVASYN